LTRAIFCNGRRGGLGGARERHAIHFCADTEAGNALATGGSKVQVCKVDNRNQHQCEICAPPNAAGFSQKIKIAFIEKDVDGAPPAFGFVKNYTYINLQHGNFLPPTILGAVHSHGVALDCGQDFSAPNSGFGV